MKKQVQEQMDAARELDLLNTKLIAIGLKKLAEMVEDFGMCKFKVLGKDSCEEAHMEEMVKLSHRIKSLLSNPPV